MVCPLSATDLCGVESARDGRRDHRAVCRLPRQSNSAKTHLATAFLIPSDDAARRAVYNNRARLKSTVARQAFKLRAEKVERSFALILDIGGLRRTWLRGAGNVEKRYLIQVAAHNLGLVIRHRFGAGTPRQAATLFWLVSDECQGRGIAIWAILLPPKLAANDTISPWKVVAFDCLITSI